MSRVVMLVSLVLATATPAQSRGGRPRPETPALQLPTRSEGAIVRIGEVLAEIGSEAETGPYMFSTIEWPTLGGDGTVYIADFAAGQIRAFDLKGRHLGTFGRRGRGPGEFVSPLILWHDGDSTLFASQLELGVAELTARGGRMSHRRTFGTGERYGSMCALGGRLFAGVGGGRGAIAELDADRREVRRFGDPFHRSDTAAVHALANQGGPSLLCDAANDALYASRSDLGVIRRYGPDGSLRWETEVPSFQHAIFGAQGSGAFVAWSVDYISTILTLGRSRLLVQVARRDFASTRGRSRAPGAMIAPEVVRVISYEVDAATGRVLSRSTSSGELMRLSDTLVAERVSEPYPLARLRSVRALVP